MNVEQQSSVRPASTRPAPPRINLDPTWQAKLGDEFEKPYMLNLKEFLHQELLAGKTIFPKGSEYFHALNSAPFDQVRVVLLGQDPYHGPGQAHGLCFSVRHGVKPPPSLENIFKELARDLGISRPHHGNLSHWAEQGVLLLNSVLTVEQGLAASHQGKGWEIFTDRIVAALNERREKVVFVLWGTYAIKKGAIIDRQRHLVLTAPHPSPLSAHRGFLGCGHFSKINDYLRANGQTEIDWQLP